MDETVNKPITVASFEILKDQPTLNDMLTTSETRELTNSLKKFLGYVADLAGIQEKIETEVKLTKARNKGKFTAFYSKIEVKPSMPIPCDNFNKEELAKAYTASFGEKYDMVYKKA